MRIIQLFLFFIYSGYATEIYKTITTAPRKELKSTEDKRKKDTPDDLHSMLPEKENRI